MSPWASASPIRTLVTAACSCMTPPSSSGTPSMLTPSSLAWSSSSLGVGAVEVGLLGDRPHLRLGEVAHAFLQHLLLVVGADVEEAARLARLLPRRPGQVLGGLEGAPGGGRRAEAVLGAGEERALDLLADADAVEQVRAGQLVEPAQAEAHAALGHALVLGCGGHLYFLPSLALASRGFTRPSRCGVPRFASRTANVDLVSLRSAGELDPAGQQDRLAEANVDLEGVGQATLERRQAARLGPHPVRDRPREAERLRRPGVHVDRVAVARDGRVAPPQVAAELPLSRRPPVLRAADRACGPDLCSSALAACRRGCCRCRGAASCWSTPRRSGCRP